MSEETRKSSIRRATQSFFVDRVFKGCGIDIGCGNDILKKEFGFPLIDSVEPFDLEHGDAQYITQFRGKDKYDFVHSSNCLEHMKNPYVALSNWLALVKPNGYLVATFPDEDLYEQGTFPSQWNHDHKWSFSITKVMSWSGRHINVLDLIDKLPDAKICRVDLIDTNYDYSLSGVDQTRHGAEAFIEIVLQKLPKYNYLTKSE